MKYLRKDKLYLPIRVGGRGDRFQREDMSCIDYAIFMNYGSLTE